jgi:HAMP domain-containing protein
MPSRAVTRSFPPMTAPRTGFRLTLQHRLTLLAMLVTLPFLGHALWAAWHERERDIANSGEHLLTIARRIAGDFAHGVSQTQQLLVLFAVTVGENQPLETLCEPTLREMVARYPVFLQAMVARPDGRVVCGVKPVPEGSSIADRDYFRRVLATRTFASSGLVVSRTTGYHALAAGYPILDKQGNVRGVTAVSVGLDQLQALFKDIQLPPGAVASLVDDEGRVVVRQPAPGGPIGIPVPDIEVFPGAVRGRDETLVTLRGGDAVTRLVAVVRVLEDVANPVYARVDLPHDVLEANAYKTLAAGLSTFALVALLAGMLAWFASRNLVMLPVRRLIDAVRRVGITDLGMRTGLADDRTELGRLAAAFDAMAARLQRSVRALRALSAGNRAIIPPVRAGAARAHVPGGRREGRLPAGDGALRGGRRAQEPRQEGARRRPRRLRGGPRSELG